MPEKRYPPGPSHDPTNKIRRRMPKQRFTSGPFRILAIRIRSSGRKLKRFSQKSLDSLRRPRMGKTKPRSRKENVVVELPWAGPRPVCYFRGNTDNSVSILGAINPAFGRAYAAMFDPVKTNPERKTHYCRVSVENARGFFITGSQFSVDDNGWFEVEAKKTWWDLAIDGILLVIAYDASAALGAANVDAEGPVSGVVDELLHENVAEDLKW